MLRQRMYLGFATQATKRTRKSNPIMINVKVTSYRRNIITTRLGYDRHNMIIIDLKAGRRQ
jgi:hypothetical protein